MLMWLVFIGLAAACVGVLFKKLRIVRTWIEKAKLNTEPGDSFFCLYPVTPFSLREACL